MAFEWIVRRQKKALFVLAVILIVGWLGGTVMTQMLTSRGRAAQAIGFMLGQPVSPQELAAFNDRWSRLFPGAFEVARGGQSSEEQERAGQLGRDRLWGFLAAVKLADRMGIQARPEEVIAVMNQIYASQTGNPNATIQGGSEEYRRWLSHLRMATPAFDATLVEYILAAKVLNAIYGGVHPTTLGAYELFLNDQRQYKLQYVEILDQDFIKEVKEATAEQIKEFYDQHAQPGDLFWQEKTYRLEYAGVLLDKIASDIKITSQEIETYYNENRDLYRLPSAPKPEMPPAVSPVPETAPPAPQPEVQFRPLGEVKQEIEQVLIRMRTRERAKELMDKLVAAYNAGQSHDLERAVRDLGSPVLVYERPEPLTLKQVSELRGIGDGNYEGKFFHVLVDEAKPEQTQLSPVVTAPQQGLYVFRLLAVDPGHPEPLDAVRERVVAELARRQAADDSRKAAEAMLENMKKPESSFQAVAATDKLKVEETPFFVDDPMDPKVPEFAVGAGLTKDTGLLGVRRWEMNRAWVVARVLETREADPADFKPMLTLELSKLQSRKEGAFVNALFPKGLLQYVNFKPATPTGQPDIVDLGGDF